jgi:hypothetical protein
MSHSTTRIAIVAVVAAGLCAWVAPDAMAIDIAPQPATEAVATVQSAVPVQVPSAPVAAPAPATPQTPVQAVVQETQETATKVVATVATAAKLQTPTATPTASTPVRATAEPRRTKALRSTNAKQRPQKSSGRSATVAAADAHKVHAAEAALLQTRGAYPLAASASPSVDERAPVLPRLPDVPQSLASSEAAAASTLLIFVALAVFFVSAAASGLMVPFRLVPALALQKRFLTRLERPG